MAVKKPRHQRMYSDSPKLERADDGNMAAIKPSEKNDARGEEPSPQTDGEPDTAPEDDARIQEIKDMHSRHQKEMEAVHKRHQKLDAKKYDNPAGDSNEKPNAGKKEIAEVSDSEKNTEQEIPMVTLTGNEILEVQGIAGNGLPSGQTFLCSTEDIANLAATDTNNRVITALSTVGAGTITAAGIIGQYTQRTGAQLSAAFTDTTDTANAIAAALPTGAGTGTSFPWTYTNLTNAPATLAGGSGVTVSAITVIPPNSFANFLWTRTGTSAFTAVGTEQGYLPHGGTFTSIGSAAVTVADTNITTYSQIVYTLKSVGGTISTYPVVKTITAGVGFTVNAGTSDLSVYNYNILG